MRNYLSVVASFFIMLCIGGVYAWSILASELIEGHGFTALQSQIIFGVVVALFPVTMIFVGRLSKTVKYRYLGYISGALFLAGYLLAGVSKGEFIIIFIGIGVLVGISTGFGYWLSLTSSVLCFPEKKGLITGIASAGFGLGAVCMSELSEMLLLKNYNVLEIFKRLGISYGIIIIIFSHFIYQNKKISIEKNEAANVREIISKNIFRKLFVGIFLGTFAGLLIIGSLRIIGSQFSVPENILILGVAIFAVANFLGRLTWGYVSDHTGASLSIFLALLFQAVAIVSFNLIPITGVSYLILASFIGFGFGGNFVLFAKETAQVYGVENLGIIYPYVFVGYAIAGIAGPFSGGLLYDLTGSYYLAIFLSSIMSIAGSFLFLYQYNREKKTKKLNSKTY